MSILRGIKKCSQSTLHGVCIIFRQSNPFPAQLSFFVYKTGHYLINMQAFTLWICSYHHFNQLQSIYDLVQTCNPSSVYQQKHKYSLKCVNLCEGKAGHQRFLAFITAKPRLRYWLYLIFKKLLFSYHPLHQLPMLLNLFNMILFLSLPIASNSTHSNSTMCLYTTIIITQNKNYTIQQLQLFSSVVENLCKIVQLSVLFLILHLIFSLGNERQKAVIKSQYCNIMLTGTNLGISSV